MWHSILVYSEHDLANEGDIYDTVEGEEDSIYDDLVSLRNKAKKSMSQQPEPEVLYYGRLSSLNLNVNVRLFLK